MMIDLDHNATTPIHPEVAQAIFDAWSARYANAASAHRAGRQARRVLEDARDSIGRILGARVGGSDGDQIILTSGGTESANLALLGMAGDSPGRIIVSSIEHPCVRGPAEQLARRGFDVQWLPAGRDGQVDLQRLAQLLVPATRLVSVMLANSETGVLQPVAQIAALCARHRIACHTDAVQAVGKIPVHFRELGVTALTLSGHKFHGPRGIGALLLRANTSLEPQWFGGHQQGALRPGTEPIELVIGLQRALQIWHRDAATRTARMAALRDRFEEQLRAANLGAVINGLGAPRLPHTSSVAFPGLDCQALHMALDMVGVACSVGSACASGSALPSQVLTAMQLPPDVVSSSLRFSLGAFTTRQEMDEAIRRIVQVVTRLRATRGSGNSAPAHPSA